MKLLAVIGLLAAACTAGRAQPDRARTAVEAAAAVENATMRLEGDDTDDPDLQALVAAQTLERLLTPGDHAAWARAKPLLNSERVHPRIRHMLLDAFATNADETIAAEMLGMALDWSAQNLELRAHPAWRIQLGERRSSVLLLAHFTQRLRDARLRKRVIDQADLLRLITEVAGGSAIQHSAPNDAYHVLNESAASPAQRSTLATAVIIAERNTTGHHPLLVKQVLPAAYPDLRAAVDRSGATMESLHWGAAAALADRGDVASRELIERKRREMAALEPRMAEMLWYFVWQIDVQNPPEGLLAHIASPTDRTVPEDRAWAVRRSVELALPPEKIRAAILAHAKATPEKRVLHRRTGRVTSFRPGLTELKQLGLELGVLRPTDLPDVLIPTTEPTP